MRWNKYTLTTTTEAEDMISSMMMDVGIEGIEIEDRVPLSEQDRSRMFVDIFPEGPEDDGVARISFYLVFIPSHRFFLLLSRIRLSMRPILT